MFGFMNKANLSDESLRMSALESLYGGQITLSTLLIKPNIFISFLFPLL